MKGTIITKKGLHLLAKLVAAETPLIFTRTAVGTGKLLSNYDPSMMLDLIEYKMDGIISSCSASGDEASVIFQISSAGIETGFFISEAGLYAEDPDEGEILYAYVDMSADTQYIYAQNEEISKFVEITLTVIIGAAKNITAYISPSSMITRKDFDEKISQLETLNFDDSEDIESIESFTDFMDSFVKGTSIYQFLTNFKAGLKYILHTGKLVNSGMCETPGEFALDAAFGKTLQDQITGLYSEMQIKTIPVKSNTSYLASITGRQMGHIIVLNSLSGWRQWYDGVITVGHIDIVPLIILSRNAILIEGQNGAINAVCGISIVDGDIKVTIPNGWNGKYSHLCIDISFLVN